MNHFQLCNKNLNTCKYIAVAGFARLVFVPSMQFTVLVKSSVLVIRHDEYDGTMNFLI